MDDAAVRAIFEDALATQEPAFGRFFLAKFLGFDITFPDETCVVAFIVRDYMFNPQGSLHGGIAAVALDVSMGHLIHHVAGSGGLTLEMKIQYMRPVRPGQVRCTGRFLKRGRSLSAMESRMTDENAKLLSMATSTWKMPE
ncbi:PaaI family thioesterase [Roseitranquillus sediminis]|uniref:PaaI family thioesterase n=1 Tax=Roseitranquillus sediminis TaxID=2809051 RepID=UPI001D0C2144|nr:PaaI family thioesterase [Roseitranquillus sediminis]MBM9595912.1 PaaI family thioesterase [Roseitranquillus sediminis]